MTDFAAMADDYVRTRRALGYRFEDRARILGQFADYLLAQGADRLTVDLAVAWAQLPEDADPVYWSERLGIVRGFARYLAAFDPATEVPPPGLLPRGSRGRLTPYLFTDSDWDHGLITIRNAKFGKSRQIPVHASTIAALQGHVQRRDALLARRDRRAGPGLFVTTTGTRIHPGRASAMVGSLIRETGLWNTGAGRQARAHDYADVRVMPISA